MRAEVNMWFLLGRSSGELLIPSSDMIEQPLK